MDLTPIAVAMGSLHALRRGSLATVVLVFGFLSVLLLLVVVVVDWVLTTRALPYGFAIVAGLAGFFMFLQWAISPAIVRWAIRGRAPVTPQTNPWLHDAITNLAREAGVPRPRSWVAADPGPNAFVFGRSTASAELVVTRGLLEKLNQDEIRAVLAHEIGHIRHRDVIIMTWVSAVPILAYVVYLVTQLLVLYLSRTREYYADAYSGAATKDPHLLASALTKISYGLSLARRNAEPSGLRAFFIGDPVKAAGDYHVLAERMARYDLDRDGQIDAFELQEALEDERRNPWSRANELLRTHPATYKRILMLEQMEEEMKQSGLPANIYRYV